jgi:hypothetical protein
MQEHTHGFCEGGTTSQAELPTQRGATYEMLQVIEIMVARDGVEPPTPAFSGLRSTT